MTATLVDQRHRQGPFDIIGDVHGCVEELRELLGLLGYRVDISGFGERRRAKVTAPHRRQILFVGDFVDRGPATPDVLRIAMAAVEDGVALAVPGNHDDKLARWIAGRPVTIAHGLDTSILQLEQEPLPFREVARRFLESLPSHLWLSGGTLAIAHAGIRSEMLGRADRRVRSFCLYGDTDGKTDAHGLTIRYDWTVEHEGKPAVIYGHTPISEPQWRNGTLCLDTGCVFGGALSALRWPENEVVSVPARAAYAERKRPFGHPDPRPRPAR